MEEHFGHSTDLSQAKFVALCGGLRSRQSNGEKKNISLPVAVGGSKTSRA